MIVDNIRNIMYYKALLPGLEAGMKAVRELGKLEVGRYEFEGGFFLVQKGTTKNIGTGTFEAHRKYADVQIIVEGSEELAWEDIEKVETVIEYNPEKDAERLNGEKTHVMLISKDMFYIAFPHDAHQPVAHTLVPQNFTKIVMKLPV